MRLSFILFRLTLWVRVFCLHVHTCTVCLPSPWSEEDVGTPGTGVGDGSEPPCGQWGLNLGPLQQQQMLSPQPVLRSHETLVLQIKGNKTPCGPLTEAPLNQHCRAGVQPSTQSQHCRQSEARLSTITQSLLLCLLQVATVLIIHNIWKKQNQNSLYCFYNSVRWRF